MRISASRKFIFAATVFILSASTANAVTFSVTESFASDGSGNPGSGVGSEFTIGIRVSADDDQVLALGASVFGYDDSMLQFVSGEAVDSIFHEIAIPGVGAFWGLSNLDPSHTETGALTESELGSSGPRVQIFSGAQSSPVTTQVLDPGLDGKVGRGDAQFRVTFRIIREGVTALRIGTGYEGDVVVLADGTLAQANNANLALSIIPEPGTALLVGLGLAGLAAKRSPHARP